MPPFTSFKLTRKTFPEPFVDSTPAEPANRKAFTYVCASFQEVKKRAKENTIENSQFYDVFDQKVYAEIEGQLTVIADVKARGYTNDFIKVLSVIALKRRKTKVMSLMPSYEKYLKGAENFIKQHKVNAKEFMAMASKGSVLKGNAEMPDGTTLESRTQAFLKNFRALYRSTIKADMESISRSQFQIINALITLLSSPGSTAAYNTVAKFITATDDKTLIPFFTFTEEDTGGKGNTLLKQRDALITKMGGDPVKGLTTEQLKKSSPELVKEYRAVLKNILNRYKHDVRNIVMAKGKKWIFLEQFAAEIKKKGWPEQQLIKYYSKTLLSSKGLIGINIDAQLTDKFGNSTGVINLSPDRASVTINEEYGEEGARRNFVFEVQSKLQAKKQKEGLKRETSKIYTLNANAEKKVSGKWEPVEDLLASDKIEKAKAAWRKGMLSKDKTIRAYSYLAEMLYLTAGRIGTGTGMTDGKQTYGISSLEPKHIVLANNKKAKVVYIGKSGQKQTHILDMSEVKDVNDRRALTKLLEFLVAAKQGKVPVFNINGARINTAKLALWFRKIFGVAKFKNHMIRYMRGTEIAKRELDVASKKIALLKKQNKLSQKVVDSLFKTAITHVATALGHFLNEKPNINTSIKSYIQPSLMTDWYKKAGFRAPTNVENAKESMVKG